MVLDGLTLFISVNELRNTVTDSKVTKINMPSREEVCLTLYTKTSGTQKLNINASGDASASFLGDMKKNNPKIPCAFCMLLRKYLTNAHITAITSNGCDRSFEIEFESKDELLHPVRIFLVAELMGKYSNIILLNSERKVLDAAKRVSVDMSSLRQILPGSRYTLPPQEQYDILSMSDISLDEALTSESSESISHYIPRSFSGISRKAADEILARSGIEDISVSDLSKSMRSHLADTFRKFVNACINCPEPSVQHNGEGLPVFISGLPFVTYPEDLRRTFDTCNEALFYYYSERNAHFILTQRKNLVIKQLGKIQSKLVRKIRTLREGIEDSKKAEDVMNRANIITANIYRLKKGMENFEAADPVTGENMVIKLDLQLHPAQNAQKLYKKAAKMKTTRQIYTKRLEEAENELEFIESSILFAGKAETMEDLAETEGILASEKIFAPQKNRKPPEISMPRKFTSPSGYAIYVGRNDKQNDRLTMGMAKKEDIWFHAQKMPGSHVLLVTEGRDIFDIDDETVEMAASLAAEYSSAKLGGKIPVDYTYRSNVKKPPASRPGKVTYEGYWTIYTEKKQL